MAVTGQLAASELEATRWRNLSQHTTVFTSVAYGQWRESEFFEEPAALFYRG